MKFPLATLKTNISGLPVVKLTELPENPVSQGINDVVFGGISCELAFHMNFPPSI